MTVASVASAACLVETHRESCTTSLSLKSATSTMSFGPMALTNAVATCFASSKRGPIEAAASTRMSHAVPTPGCAALSPQRALDSNLAGRSAPSTETVNTAFCSGKSIDE